MKKMIEGHTDRRSNIVFATKLVLMMYAMLIAVPLLQHWLYFGKKLACGWSLMLSAYLIYTDREHYKTKEYLLMALFCISYGVTILLNRHHHFANEILILGYIIALYFTLTYFDSRMSLEQVEKELRILAYAMVTVAFIFSAVNIGIYFAIYSGVLHTAKGSYFYGIIGTQLGGIYNPNTSGTINYIAMVLTLFLLKEARREKIFLWLNLFVQLWCFSLVQSRGSWVSLLAFIVLYFLFVWDRPSLGTVKKIAAKLLLMVLCILLVAGASKSLRNTTVSIIRREETSEEIAQIEKIEGIIAGDRDMNNGGHSDFTTGRAELWKIGFEKLLEKPVMGIGYRSIDDVLEKELSVYDYKNSGAGGLHNIYLTVMLSGGIVGFVFFAALIVLLLLKVLKIYRSPNMPVYVKYLVTLIPVWLVGDLAESRIALSLNQLSVLFWIMAGYVLYYAKVCDRVDQCARSGE